MADKMNMERTCPHVHVAGAPMGAPTSSSAPIRRRVRTPALPQAPTSPTAPSGACEDTCAPGPKYGWHTRGYLPHFDSAEVIQMVTFRLADSLPRRVAERLAEETDTDEGNAAYRERIEAWLDAGHGECLLRDPRVAKIVEDSLRFFDGTRYELLAWVIMPNHVHILVRMLSPHTLSDAIKGWKSFTARKINERLRRAGTVWQKEYWDRFIRNETHYLQAMAYIHENPVKAGLAAHAEDWRFGSARVAGAHVSSRASGPEPTRTSALP